MRTLLKHAILDELDFEGKTVVDLGCGKAEYWAESIATQSKWELHCIEPDSAVLRVAAQELHHKNVQFLTSSVQLPSGSADYVFCFSVLEHVWDLEGFLYEVARILKPEGRAFLNYDDGHFRNHLYRLRGRLFRAKNSLKTCLFLLWKYTRKFDKYQKPIDRVALAPLISSAGLVVVSETYSEIDGLKKIERLVDERYRDELISQIIQLEISLNKLVMDKSPSSIELLRGHSALWAVMSSCTIELSKMRDKVDSK
jgi:SAM-dependent methyltransferase